MLLHTERLGVKYVPIVTKKPPKARIIRCMICNLLYNINAHRDGCPTCKGKVP